ncbi:MAG: tetraacyldisaccharide 4'-kinase [Gemmatimonadaceae bacterium]
MAEFHKIAEGIWSGRGFRHRAARALLSPLEIAYRTAMATRGALYDRGILSAEEFAVPVVSVGNLTVGGTGKTPVSAWLARQLTDRGMKAAIVLRGYGGDETIVHRRLNADVAVITAAVRPRGVREAIANGANVVVLDDAFQHRGAGRSADILLLNADAWTGSVRLLPAGPWREPLSAARRASLVLVTRKVAEADTVDNVRRAVARAAPQVPIAVVHLMPSELRSTATGQAMPLQAVREADLTAIAAIAQPEVFFKQLTELGAVVRPHSYPDHYPFTRDDATDLASQSADSDFVVCTLKDAVKLESLWPAEAGSLWYVSQRLKIEDGKDHIDHLLDDLGSRFP